MKIHVDLEKAAWGKSVTSFILPGAAKQIHQMDLAGHIVYEKKMMRANLRFSGLFVKRLYKIEIFPIMYSSEKTREGRELSDFFKELDVLIEFLGKPNKQTGEELRKDSESFSVFSLKKSQLPTSCWTIGNSKVIHEFKDYWGLVPFTYAIKD